VGRGGSAGIQTKKPEIQVMKMVTYTLTGKTYFLTLVYQHKNNSLCTHDSYSLKGRGPQSTMANKFNKTCESRHGGQVHNLRGKVSDFHH
jgi:hypothetical protein